VTLAIDKPLSGMIESPFLKENQAFVKEMALYSAIITAA